MRTRPSIGLASLAALGALCVAPPILAANAKTEAAAKTALKQAEADFATKGPAAAGARLDKAIKACGASACETSTKAALLRDFAATQLRQGDKVGAVKSLRDAFALEGNLALNPAYDSPELRAAFEEAGGKTPQPSGDFTHTPPSAQAADTPLPVYFEGGPQGVARVVVKYKGASMTTWRRVDLKKMGDGWGGYVPCVDVTPGTMHYFVTGLDDTGSPVGNSGDATHAYHVRIVDQLSGEAPHLPGKSAPKACGESGACPSGFAACNKPGASAGDSGDENGEAEKKGGEEEEGPAGPYKKMWVGAALGVDFMSVPAGDQLCLRDPNTGAIVNQADGKYVYCTKQNGADFPDSPAQNAELDPNAAGHSPGGINHGVVRLQGTFDYALMPNLLVGGRLGLTFFKYLGTAASNDGRAFGGTLGRLNLDARATYLFGKDPLARAGLAPMAFAGAGISAFDSYATGPATLNTQDGPASGNVRLWITNGPFFVMAGGGARYALSSTMAVTGAVRINASFGANGMIPTFGPEIGGQYGF